MSRTFFIAGVKFHQLRDVVDQIKAGDKLDLVPEPENTFDSNAVRIDYNGTVCGYVPKAFSAEIAAAINFEPTICTVDYVNPNAKTYEMCQVSIGPANLDEDEDVEFDEFDEDKEVGL
jgi:hypothetical protein